MKNSSWKISAGAGGPTDGRKKTQPLNRSSHAIGDFYLASIGQLRRTNTLEKRLRPASLGLEKPPAPPSVLDLLRDRPAQHFRQAPAVAKPLADFDRCFASLADVAGRLGGIRYELSVSMQQSLLDAHRHAADALAAIFDSSDAREKELSKQVGSLRRALASAEREAGEWRERCGGFERSVSIYHLEVDSYRATVEHLKREIAYLNEHNRQIVAALSREDAPDPRADLRAKLEGIRRQASAVDAMIDGLMADDSRLALYSSYKSVLARMAASSVDRATQTAPQPPAEPAQPGQPGQPASLVGRFVHRLAEEGVHALPQPLVEAAVLELFRFVVREPERSMSMEEYLCAFHIRRSHHHRLATIHAAQMLVSLRCYRDSRRCCLLLRLLEHPAVDPLLAADTCLALVDNAGPHGLVRVAAVRPLLERLAHVATERDSVPADELALMAVDARLAEAKAVSAAIKGKLSLDASIDQLKAAVTSVDPRYRGLALDRCLLLTFLEKHELDLDAFLRHLAQVRLHATDAPAPPPENRDKPLLPAEAPRVSGASPRLQLDRSEDEGRQLLDAGSAIFAHHYAIIRSVRQYLLEFSRQAREDLEAKELFQLVADLGSAVESAVQYLSYPIHL